MYVKLEPLSGCMSLYHGKTAEAICPKIFIEIHLDPVMVYGSFYLDSWKLS